MLFAGCRASIQTELKLSDLASEKPGLLQGDLFIEVPACGSMEDSRKPSTAVEKARADVPGIFEDARYMECFRKQFKSLAHFRIPVVVAKDKVEKAGSDNIATTAGSDALWSVSILEKIRKNIETVQSGNFGTSALDFAVDIVVMNDTEKAFTGRVWSAFVNGHPVVHGSVEVQPGRSISVQRSDVSVASAMQSGSTLVLSR